MAEPKKSTESKSDDHANETPADKRLRELHEQRIKDSK